MADIAQEIGISKKTLYANFSSKDTLLGAVLEQKFDQIETDLDLVLSDQSVSFSEKLKVMLATFHRHIGEIKPAFVRDIQRSDGTLFQKINQRRQCIIRKSFGRLFEAGRQEGFIREDIAVPVLVEILVGITVNFVTPDVLVKLNMTADQAFSQLMCIFLDGILVKKHP